MKNSDYTFSRRNVMLGAAGSVAIVASRAFAQDKPIKLAVNHFASSSGPAAAFQAVTFPPTKMAMEDLAKEGITFDYTAVDSRLDPKTAVSEFQRRAPQAVFIMGPAFSTEFAAIGPIANRLGVPVLSGGAAATDIAKQNRPWVFMMNPDPRPLARDGVNTWLRVASNVKNVVIVRDQKDVATKLQADLVAEALAASTTAKLAETVSFETAATDFSAIVTRALSSKPDGIVIAALPNDATAITVELRRQKPDATILATPSAFAPSYLKNTGDAIEGVFSYSSFWVDESNPRVRAFADRYRAETGFDPPFTVAFNYEAWMLLGAALRATQLEGKSLEEQRAALLKSLQTVTITGVMGQPVRFNADGFVDRQALLLRVKRGGVAEKVQ